MSGNPRWDPECENCPGEYQYQGQTKTPRDEWRSVYECAVCGDERRVR